MNLTDDERRAFDLYFAHAYQAKANERATARARAPAAAITQESVDYLVDKAAEIAEKMLAARREILGDPNI